MAKLLFLVISAPASYLSLHWAGACITLTGALYGSVSAAGSGRLMGNLCLEGQKAG